jgi:hypothetical protein
MNKGATLFPSINFSSSSSSSSSSSGNNKPNAPRRSTEDGATTTSLVSSLGAQKPPHAIKCDGEFEHV